MCISEEMAVPENENGIKMEVITFFLYLFPYKKILRLKHFICIWIGACFLCASLQKAGATAVPKSYAGQRAYADSIMDKVIFFAPFYERIVDEYKAELYIKGWANIRKKNHLLRFIPSMFRMKRTALYRSRYLRPESDSQCGNFFRTLGAGRSFARIFPHKYLFLHFII